VGLLCSRRLRWWRRRCAGGGGGVPLAMAMGNVPATLALVCSGEVR